MSRPLFVWPPLSRRERHDRDLASETLQELASFTVKAARCGYFQVAAQPHERGDDDGDRAHAGAGVNGFLSCFAT